jgi:predicted DNA-binding transcriptional regulator AlpA
MKRRTDVEELLSALFEQPLIDVKDVARMIGSSSRHVARLAKDNRLPRPIKVGRLTRWRRVEIIAWIERGCPAANS